MLLTFNVLYDKIIKMEKKQTIRANWKRWKSWYYSKKIHPQNPDHWQVMYETRGKKYMIKNSPIVQVYWKNPRNGGKKMGEGVVTSLRIMKTSEFTKEIAIADGFDSIYELNLALSERNSINSIDSIWAVITFDWLYPPLDVLGGEVE